MTIPDQHGAVMCYNDSLAKLSPVNGDTKIR